MDVVHPVRQSGTAMQTYTAEALVELLELSPHPEGGYFRETFRANQRVQRSDDTLSLHDRAAGTAIYYLLPAGAFSAWHRVRSDEVWHHYDGAPAELHLIDLTGSHTTVLLGRDLARGEAPAARRASRLVSGHALRRIMRQYNQLYIVWLYGNSGLRIRRLRDALARRAAPAVPAPWRRHRRAGAGVIEPSPCARGEL